jgi:hypothetical protein
VRPTNSHDWIVAKIFPELRLSPEVVMNVAIQVLERPPFPRLTFTDCEWWEGRIDLGHWAGFGEAIGGDPKEDAEIIVCPHDPTSDPLPSPAHEKALRYYLAHEAEIVDVSLAALRGFSEKLRPHWIGYFGSEETDRILPVWPSSQALKSHLSLSSITVTGFRKDDMSYIGLQFACSWDEEHGAGVLLHGSRVVEVGMAEVAFAVEPQEATE